MPPSPLPRVDRFRFELPESLRMTSAAPQVLARGRYIQLIREGHWEYADRVKGRCAVAIAAVTANQELVLTQQYRIPLKKIVIDLAAGLVGDEAGAEHEADQPAAERELLEETGYASDDWVRVFTGPLSAGMTTELVTFFVARNARKVGAGGGAGNEDITQHVVPLQSLLDWLRARTDEGILIDPKIYAAVGMLHLLEMQRH